MKVLSKIIISTLLTLSVSLGGCAILVKEADMNDNAQVSKLSENLVYSFTNQNTKVKNIAIAGYLASALASEQTNDQMFNAFATLKDLSSNRACIALDKSFEIAPKILESFGFNVLSPDKLAENATYKKIGGDSFPGICNAGKTRLNMGFFAQDDLQKMMEELNLDGVLIAYFVAENDSSHETKLYLWTKGTKTAELAWQGGFGRAIQVESDTPVFFREYQEMAKSDQDKAALTYRVFNNTFKLLSAKLAKEMQK